MARIAIDARKLRDYGIGTYVRNLLRQLGRQETTHEYVAFCREQDRETVKECGPRIRPVVEQAGAYSISEQFAVPLDLRRSLGVLRLKCRDTPCRASRTKQLSGEP